MHAFIFFGAVKMCLRSVLGARADPNAKAGIRVRLADTNGQKADESVVRLGRREQKVGQTRRPKRTRVRGRPISGPFLSRICVGADTRRTRARSLSPLPGPAGRWLIGFPPHPPSQTATLARLLRRRRRRPFLRATLPAVAASTSAQQHHPLPRRPPPPSCHRGANCFPPPLPASHNRLLCPRRPKRMAADEMGAR